MKAKERVTGRPSFPATYDHPLGFYINNHNRPSRKKIEQVARLKHTPLPPDGNEAETTGTTVFDP